MLSKIKNSLLYKIHARYEKNRLFKKDLKIHCCFFIGVISFHLFLKNLFIKMKKSIFPPKYLNPTFTLIYWNPHEKILRLKNVFQSTVTPELYFSEYL